MPISAISSQQDIEGIRKVQQCLCYLFRSSQPVYKVFHGILFKQTP